MKKAAQNRRYRSGPGPGLREAYDFYASSDSKMYVYMVGAIHIYIHSCTKKPQYCKWARPWSNDRRGRCKKGLNARSPSIPWGPLPSKKAHRRGAPIKNHKKAHQN